MGKKRKKHHHYQIRKETRQKAVKKPREGLSTYEKWYNSHREIFFLKSGWQLMLMFSVIVLGLGVLFMSYSYQFSNHGIGVLRNSLTVIGYSVIGFVVFLLVRKQDCQLRSYLLYGLTILGMVMVGSFYLIVSSVIWLSDLVATNQHLKGDLGGLFLSLLAILLIKISLIIFRQQLDEKKIKDGNNVVGLIKGMIFIVAFVNCRGWVLLLGQELLVIIPLGMLGIGLFFFGFQDVLGTGYLLITDKNYRLSSHETLVTTYQKASQEKEKRKKEIIKRKEKEKNKPKNWFDQRLTWGLKLIVLLHLVVLFGVSIFLYSQNIKQVKASFPDISIPQVIGFQSRASLERFSFLNQFSPYRLN